MYTSRGGGPGRPKRNARRSRSFARDSAAKRLQKCSAKYSQGNSELFRNFEPELYAIGNVVRAAA